MCAFDRLAKDHLAPDLELPPLHRIGSAILGSGFFGGMRYRNLLRVGSCPAGLVLVLGGRQLLIAWELVSRAQAPWGIFPREKWLVGAEQVPLIVPADISGEGLEKPGTVQPPD